ncbi:MAG TPA: helix-turn-helix domain-containing protein [Streptosporangiaceae bacterium]|nr:helix-turn-helix domain-containing protein [Streptosporangiaceae bacterium]
MLVPQAGLAWEGPSQRMEPHSDLHPAAQKIATAAEATMDTLVDLAVEAIWQQVPAYMDSHDEQLRRDVTVHVRSVFTVFLAGVTGGRPARRADFVLTRQQATRRVSQGISLADFLHAFRIGQLVLWQGVLDAAGEEPLAREAALSLVAELMRVIELGSTVAAEAYVEAQQHALAESDRVRRDLLEDLLARRSTFAGPKGALLRTVGLGPDTRLLVATAAPAGELPHSYTLRDAAAVVGRVRGGRGRGLAVVRQDEIVCVTPVPRAGVDAAVADMRQACTELAEHRVRLAVGVSTVHPGLLAVPEAYSEARVAREGLGQAEGVLALPLLTTFDYLVLRDDETARRLVRPEVRQFVAEDLAAGGALIATLVEFAACDLNAKTAAERLHLHVNTAYYRLERIAERTGCDLRKLTDVMELLIAVRVLGARPPLTAGTS